MFMKNIINREGDLQKPTALVVGATSGIGQAIVKLLLSQNVRVIATSRSKAKWASFRNDIGNTHEKCIRFAELDFEDEQSYIDFQDILNEENFINYYVNCVGEAPKYTAFEDAQTFQRILNINFLLVARVTGMVIEKMINQKKGRLVLIGSLATQTGVAGVSYICSKAALESFVLHSARNIAEVAPEVVLSMVSPGPVDVPGKGLHRLSKQNHEGLLEWLRKNRIYLDRLALTDEIAECVSFLLNSKTNYLHGTNLRIDAGGHNN